MLLRLGDKKFVLTVKESDVQRVVIVIAIGNHNLKDNNDLSSIDNLICFISDLFCVTLRNQNLYF
jgi:hypothetical protein